jgi:hypothetical protein
MIRFSIILFCCFLGFGSVGQDKLFEIVPPESSGITFENIVPENHRINIILYPYHYNGGGVAVGDINNDGLSDIYFTRNDGSDKLYLNKGNLKFQDITKSAGVSNMSGWKTGVTMVDINGDGLLDIYVCKSGDNAYSFDRNNVLFINNGDLTFSDKAEQYGLNDNGYSTQAAFFDIDNDNDLDMYLLNHNVKEVTSYNPEIDGLWREPYVSDKLFINNGSRFYDISKDIGLKGNKVSYGLGIGIGDFDQNGYPDLYVGNDFQERDFFYYNEGDLKLKESLTSTFDHISNFSMGLDIADFNNDQLLDLFVVDMVAADHYRAKTNMKSMDPETFWKAVDDGQHYQYMVNTMQMNNGNNSFSEVGLMLGIAKTDWSWSPLIADFDNDGMKDIFVSNGLRKDVRNNDYVIRLLNYMDSLSTIPKSQSNVKKEIETALAFIPSQKIPNYLFHNKGEMKFQNMADEWGLEVPTFSNGAAYGDLDNDGDLDLVINNLDSVAFLYENTSNQSGVNYAQIKLEGYPTNTFALGTKVWITTPDGETQFQELYLTRGFQSSSDPVLHFGLGNNQSFDLKVKWTDGSVLIRKNQKPNKRLSISYSKKSDIESIDSKPSSLFSQADILTSVTHEENFYDDFALEVLLPHKLSDLGPAFAKGDVNQDGLEDFYIGGAYGFPGRLLLQKAGMLFDEMVMDQFNEPAYEDTDALFFDFDMDGDLDLYVSSGSNEFEDGSENQKDRIYINTNGRLDEILVMESVKTNTSCVRVSDFDKDGDPDLFVGGRVKSKKYPFPASSYLLVNENGKYVDKTKDLAEAIQNVGLVTDAEWIDLDKDGYEDLVIVGEWMKPVIMINDRNGKFSDQSVQWGMDKMEGWWFSVGSGDFDGNGYDDLILGNLGRNYKFKASKEKPFEVFADDFDATGTVDIVLSYYDDKKLVPVRGRQCSSEQMPFIKEKFPTYHEFAVAGIEDILGDAIQNSLNYKVYTFEHHVLLNDGKKFTANPLPRTAQLSPIRDFIIMDIDGDRKLDVIAAGNLYGSEVETPRADAGKGMVLLGDGNGNFLPKRPHESGLYLDGDVRQLELFSTDGSMYLIGARNGNAVKSFQFME